VRFGLCATSAAIVLTLTIAACSSPDQEARDARKAATSWAATILAAAEQWQAGAVPSHFVSSTLDAAQKSVSSDANRIRERAGAEAARPLERVRDAIPNMIAACDRGDAEGVTARARELLRQ